MSYTAFAQTSNHPDTLADMLAINNLILSYGFYVDLCDADAVANLWTEDGEYCVEGLASWKGRQDLKDMVASPMHQAYVRAGCMHFMGAPQITIEHNDAYARSNTLLIACDAAGFTIDRASHNFWHLKKTADGWKVFLRKNTLVAPKESS